MNTQLFEQAKAAYAANNYQAALQGFNACLNDPMSGLLFGERGLLYHQIGNCLVKLNSCPEAIQAYGQAAADSAYDAKGSVHYNLGMAYASMKDYEDAIEHFKLAAADGKYDSPYKAYSAMGNALMKLGKSAEAGVSFRQAALDDRNPDPTKSLLNLGVCFMALNRPEDAVISYESALQFDMDQSVRNKIYANLGQAYASSGQMQKACSAFEEAIADKTYFLSDSASVDYQRAIAAIAQGTDVIPAQDLQNQDGFDVIENDYYQDNFGYDQQFDQYDQEYDQYGPMEAYDEFGNPIGYYDENGIWHDEPLGEDRFFNASDAEIEMFAQGNEKAGRKRRNSGMKAAIAIIIAVVIIFGGGITAYILGLGFPSQESVVEQLFDDPDAAATKVFAPDLTESKAIALSNMVEDGCKATTVGMEKSMGESTAYVEATLKDGGTMYYKISMVRDFIGWKISNIELYFASQNR